MILDPEKQPLWSYLCDVDVSALAEWLAFSELHWPKLPSPDSPQRVFGPVGRLVRPVVDAVLSHFPECHAPQTMLSRVRPGQSHPMHVDIQQGGWVTRVHVPVKTNPAAWLLWEEEGRRVHFGAGKAYTFDTLKRHAFGNDGHEERVHLIFDVMRR